MAGEMPEDPGMIYLLRLNLEPFWRQVQLSSIMLFSLNPDDRKRIDRALDLFEKYLQLLREKNFEEKHQERVRQIRGLS